MGLTDVSYQQMRLNHELNNCDLFYYCNFDE